MEKYQVKKTSAGYLITHAKKGVHANVYATKSLAVAASIKMDNGLIHFKLHEERSIWIKSLRKSFI